MSINNTTFFLRQPALNTSTLYCGTHSFDFYKVTIPILVAMAILSPVAVVGNGLVLAAIWKNPSLRTPSYILLAGLALTDFCTGTISEPFLVANELVHSLIQPSGRNMRPSVYFTMRIIADSCFEYFFNLTLLIMTLMSIERWLHMSQRSLLTVRRLHRIIVVLFFSPIPFVVYRLQEIYDFAYLFTNILFVLLCLFVTTVAYFKVFHIIRRHQQQICVNGSSPNFAQPAINLAKYKKSVFSILYIVVIFYTGYLPMAITQGLGLVFHTNCSVVLLSFYVSTLLVFLSSSLNPLLYLWRMTDIRQEVRKLVKRIFSKDN